uniref:Aminoacylase-1 n=1 Tax=Plectus sambesii TaxID=2011161 RepID=A0A914W117_9BILA
MAHEEDIAVTTFRNYLRIDTEQPNPNYKACEEFLHALAAELQIKCSSVECVPGKPVVIMTIEGKNPSLPSLFLYSHTDVVPTFKVCLCCESVLFLMAAVMDNSPTIGRTSKDDPWWNEFSSVLDEMHLKYKTEVFVGATDSRYLRQLNYKAIGFSPMINTPQLLHDHNEFLNENVFLRGVDIYAKLIPRLANLPDH